MEKMEEERISRCNNNNVTKIFNKDVMRSPS